jgi:rare lipoprotein A
MARKLLACSVGILSIMVAVPGMAAAEVSENVLRLDRPSQPAQVSSQSSYTRIDPRQLAATSTARAGAAGSQRQTQSTATATPPVNARPAAQAASRQTAVRRASGEAASVGSQRPSRTSVTSPSQNRPVVSAAVQTPASRRPAVPAPVLGPASQSQATGPVDDRPASEVSLFPELAPYVADSREMEAAPWQKIGAPYEVRGVWYIPAAEPDYDETGTASWYGPGFHGQTTANGELFDQTIPSAAHPTLPIPSLVEVTNLANNRSIVVRVNDRGPFAGDRLIDLSQRGAELLDFRDSGTAQVRVRYVGPASREPLVTAANLAPAPAQTNRMPAPRTQTARRPETPTSVPSPTQPRRPANVEAVGTGRSGRQTTTNVSAGGATLQLGAFSSRANAERAQRQAASLGVTSIRETTVNGRQLFRVILNAPTPEAAAQARDRALSLGLGATVIASLN